MKLRDLLAVPFWALALFFNYLAVSIGGKWTAQMFKKQDIDTAKLWEQK